MAKVAEISQEKISYDKVEKVKATTRYSMDAKLQVQYSLFIFKRNKFDDRGQLKPHVN
jgi:hypothetical protein